MAIEHRYFTIYLYSAQPNLNMVYLRVLHYAEMYKASQHTPLAQMRKWLRGRQTSFRTTSTATIGISVINTPTDTTTQQTSVNPHCQPKKLGDWLVE